MGCRQTALVSLAALSHMSYFVLRLQHLPGEELPVPSTDWEQRAEPFLVPAWRQCLLLGG